MYQWIRFAFIAFCIFGVLFVAHAAADVLTVTSQAPGNIVTTATPLTCTVHGASVDVHYCLTDYFGRRCAEDTVAAQNGTAVFTLPTLAPGYYDLACNSGEQKTTVSLGVLLDRGNAPLPRDGRIGTAVAMGILLVQVKDFQPLSHIIRMAGIPWVREQMSWASVEKIAGQYDWGGVPYQYALDCYAAEGIYVHEMDHDAPVWSHPKHEGLYCSPDDLRDLYRYMKTMSAHYGPRIHAWEMGNEADGGFWDDLSDRFVGYEKACYLGLKDGNPELEVFPGAMCYWFGAEFGRRVFESIPGYGDGYNWHYYSWSDQTVPEKGYASTLHGKAPYVSNSWVTGLPIRLTEVGHVLRADANGIMSAADQRNHAQFMPRMAACGIAAGNEKIFYFLLPYYYEGNVYQFGALHRDLTPTPSFLALSAAANMIGQCSYLGQYHDAANPGVLAYAFATPRGNVLVTWSDVNATLSIPTEQPSAHVANIFGAPQPDLAAHTGTLTLPVGPDATYLIGIGDAIITHLERPAPVKPAKRVTPSRLVVVGHDDHSLTLDHGSDTYVLDKTTADGALAPFTYLVDVYNFDTTTARGSVRLKIPSGWKAQPASCNVTVTPMGREVCTFTVTPQAKRPIGCAINVVAAFGTTPVAPSASYFSIPAELVTPQATRPLAWTNATLWHQNNAANTPTKVRNVDAKTLALDITLVEEGDRWAYPYIQRFPPMDVSGYDALTFDYQSSIDDGASSISVMLIEGNSDVAYKAGGLPVTTKPRHAVLYFKNFDWFALSAMDDNGHLNLEKIGTVRFGGNFNQKSHNSLTITVSNFALVKFAK